MAYFLNLSPHRTASAFFRRPNAPGRCLPILIVFLLLWAGNLTSPTAAAATSANAEVAPPPPVPTTTTAPVLAPPTTAPFTKAAALTQNSTPNTPERTVTIAAAADLKFALPDLAAAFAKDHPPIKLQITYGSSGNFYTQLTQQAPFDV
ncbi:MAG: substrate-binding domain-containing protein, partial [Phycisphaerae bacterium]